MSAFLPCALVCSGISPAHVNVVQSMRIHCKIRKRAGADKLHTVITAYPGADEVSSFKLVSSRSDPPQGRIEAAVSVSVGHVQGDRLQKPGLQRGKATVAPPQARQLHPTAELIA